MPENLQRGDFVGWSEARPMQQPLEKTGVFLSIDNHGCALVRQANGKICEIYPPSQLRPVRNLNEDSSHTHVDAFGITRCAYCRQEIVSLHPKQEVKIQHR